MGAWGTGLFQDDFALDVRDDYRELLLAGAGGSEATDQLLEQYREALTTDLVHGPIFWLALAVTQWEVGRLEDRVKDRALAVLDDGEGLEIWEDDPALLKRRKAALAKIRAKLLKRQPRPKRLRRSPAPRVDIGDVVEIATPRGLAYAQYTHRHPIDGPVLRVLPGLYQDRPPDLASLVAGGEVFFTFYFVDRAERKKEVTKVGAFPVPEHAAPFPVFRHGIPQPGGGSVWKRWDGKQVVGQWTHWDDLAPEFRRLSPVVIIPHSSLVDRIVRQWRPEDSPF